MLNPSASALAERHDPGFGRTRQVLLVDDQALCRIGVKALFADTADADAIEWIEASSLHEALHLHAEHPAVSLVVLDLNMSDCKGLQGLRQMLAQHPHSKVVILSGTQDEFVVRQARAMGAAGYLHKGSAPDATRDALRELVLGDADATARTDLRPSSFPPCPALPSHASGADLSPRHLEILELVLSGCTNQEISNSTRLSLGTVKNYVSTILLAHEVKSRSHLITLFR